MSKVRKATTLVAIQGENLVTNELARLLHWIARKDHPDEGIDLNVEIPDDDERPRERFLVQVKTASRVRPTSDGSWRFSVKRSAANSYLKSRLAVFGMGVDLTSNAIRWIDLSQALQREPTRCTFRLPASNALDAARTQHFRSAVRAAADRQDDLYHSPAKALEYRARQKQAGDTKVSVTASIVDGVETYKFTAKENVSGRLTVLPRTRRDTRRLLKAHEFGSSVEAEIRHFKMEGSPALAREHVGLSKLRLTSRARKLRVAITTTPSGDRKGRITIELDGEMSKGFRGFELRSADAECPLQFALQLALDKRDADYAFEILWGRWNGQPYAGLPLVDRLADFTRCFQEGCHVTIEVIRFGERTEILSTTVRASRSVPCTSRKESRATPKISLVCRAINSQAVFVVSELASEQQVNSLDLAYQLAQTSQGNIPEYTQGLVPTADARPVLLQRPPPPMQLRFSLILGFGNTHIGEMRLKAEIKDYAVTDDGRGGLVVTKSDLLVMQDL